MLMASKAKVMFCNHQAATLKPVEEDFVWINTVWPYRGGRVRVILRLAALLSLRGLQLRIATRYDTLGNRLRKGPWTQAILAELQMSFDSRHFLALEFLIL